MKIIYNNLKFKNQASSCPKHLLFSKLDNILEAIDEKNSNKAMSFIIDLKNESEDDESAYEQIASSMLKVLLIDKTKRNLEVLSYLFEKAEKNYFNSELCVPVLGILLLIKTGTKTEVIEEIYKRMENMAGEKLEEMLSQLPNDCHHKSIIKRFKNGKSKCR